MIDTSQKFSPRSGRSKIAQRFIAGKGSDDFFPKVRGADDRDVAIHAYKSVARFTGSVSLSTSFPSTEVLGYFQASAARTL